MKKYSKIAYIILILIVFVSGFGVYKMINKQQPKQDEKSKALSEVKYLESKFVDLFNQVNNITFENYKISSTDIKGKKSEEETQTSGQNGGQSSGGQNSGQGSGQSGSSGNSGSSGSSSSQGAGQDSSEDSEQNKEYELQSTGILTGDKEPNWDEIKNDVERTYTFLYPTTVDLYQIDVNQDDIVNFNKEYDNLTQAVKNESKEDTLEELTLLYEYVPRFIESCTDEEKEKIVAKTKKYIFKAYSALDQEQWATISENINKAAEEFTKLVTNINNQENGNQYNINKTYIIINELQNAVLLRDKEVFLIKYKNVLEEIENI